MTKTFLSKRIKKTAISMAFLQTPLYLLKISAEKKTFVAKLYATENESVFIRQLYEKVFAPFLAII